jgi:hypothetical protein
MSVNSYLPHVFVLPEDDANRQIANGFVLSLSTRQIQVLKEAGGWASVRDRFESDQRSAMERNPNRFVVLLVDFDGNNNRLQTMRAVIPDHLKERVFVLGAFSEPEELRQAGLGSYEAIGRALAEDCRTGAAATWGHELLQHNEEELSRLREQIVPILFHSNQ